MAHSHEMRRNALAVVCLILGFGIGGIAPVVAADVYGTWKYYGPYSGIEYKNRSYVSAWPPTLQGTNQSVEDGIQ